MGTVIKYPRLQIDAVRGAAKSLRARYFIKGLWSSEELIRLCLSENAPKKRRGGRPKKKNNFATYNKARQDAKLADAKAAEAAKDVQPTAAPPDPPPAASSEAKPGSPSSLPHSIEENLVVPTPQLGSGSTGTASSAPGAAA